MTAVILDRLEQIISDHSIPCDYAAGPVCRDTPAAWILFAKPCDGCSWPAEQRLACDICKTWRMESGDAVECGACGFVITPARHAYTRCEAL